MNLGECQCFISCFTKLNWTVWLNMIGMFKEYNLIDYLYAWNIHIYHIIINLYFNTFDKASTRNLTWYQRKFGGISGKTPEHHPIIPSSHPIRSPSKAPNPAPLRRGARHVVVVPRGFGPPQASSPGKPMKWSPRETFGSGRFSWFNHLIYMFFF